MLILIVNKDMVGLKKSLSYNFKLEEYVQPSFRENK